VPTMVAEDAELRTESASIARAWSVALDDLESAIRRITGGERDSLALARLETPRVVAASAVLPAAPGLLLDGNEALLRLAVAVPSMVAAGAVIAESGLVLSLGGDTAQTPRGAEDVPTWSRSRAAAAGPEALRLYEFTTSARRRAFLDEAAEPSPGPESIADVREVLDRSSRPGRTPPHREVDTPEELTQVHGEITRGGESIPPPTNSPIVSSTRLGDGTIINWRDASRSGGPSVDITTPGSKTIEKLHLPKGYGQ
jgi:hypothetical protein